MENLVYSVMNEVQQELFKKHLEIDFSTKLSNDVRFRVNAFHQINGISAAFRVIPNEIKQYEELHFTGSPEEDDNQGKGINIGTDLR